MCEPGIPESALDRRDGDDRAALGIAHRLGDGPDGQERALRVDIEDVVPFGSGEFEDVGERLRARAADEDVRHRTEFTLGSGHDGGRVVASGDVEDEGSGHATAPSDRFDCLGE